ncbi:hypothetical protein JHN59_35400 [Streptomyces sp. MBT49]|uniref:hypothetical protein n=1 Tax=Streptomyces sp. MBT49 TaxID=1488380 RepID=UPI00190DDE5A|nr:hypothetical protein [Streptomyces sp. MBT49]MBK3629996.1 hypothetical protein [Streptomyces sp. MBT49]
MARTWTRVHEHLGCPPGPITFDMVRQAAADKLEESDDLDWKEMEQLAVAPYVFRIPGDDTGVAGFGETWTPP